MSIALLVVNIILGLALGYLQITCWAHIRKQSWAWVRMASGVVGLLWAVIYIVLLYQAIYQPPTNLEFVTYTLGVSRPAVTVTLAVLLSNVIISKRVR